MILPSSENWQPHDVQDLEQAAWNALYAKVASVTAGPGAGKTEFLAQKAGYLLETGGCRAPQRILAISFKRSAATNLRDRVQSRLPEHAHRFNSMTFDAFTKSIVDQFGALLPPEWKLSSHYKIGFSTKDDIRSFLNDISASLSPKEVRAVQTLSPSTFIPNILGANELPPIPSERRSPTSAQEYAVWEWWDRQYFKSTPPTVDFVMLNRLADLIIRTNPNLQRALRATYPVVFIDEFQDTTYAQYSFLKAVFPPGKTDVTVVGDSKQRIMGWAGALTDAFTEFNTDFKAETFSLTSNFRSTQELVDLQHRFAIRLDPHATPQHSYVPSTVGETPVQIWSFSTAKREAETIAAWIASDIETTGRQPSDYALIARQQVNILEPELDIALTNVGLRLRNDDEQIGNIRLQDLLTNDLVHLLLGLLTLAAHKGGQPQVWHEVTNILSRIWPIEDGMRVESEINDALDSYLKDLRKILDQNSIDVALNSSSNERIATNITNSLTDFAEIKNIEHKRLFGDKLEDITTILEAFHIRLVQTLTRVNTWECVADAFFDQNAVSLLTIHRSKGLEYSTVFFIGLDSDQWWAHARNKIESTMTFFVGSSRAAERLFFTQCSERGKPAQLGSLYQDMQDAGVSIVHFE